MQVQHRKFRLAERQKIQPSFVHMANDVVNIASIINDKSSATGKPSNTQLTSSVAFADNKTNSKTAVSVTRSVVSDTKMTKSELKSSEVGTFC